jgi:hypothetical protein
MFANDGVGLHQLGAVWASLMGRQHNLLLGLMLGLNEKSDQEGYYEEKEPENPEPSIIMSLLLRDSGGNTSQRSGENEADKQ